MKTNNIETTQKVNQEVLLEGWVNTIRKMGKIVFVDLRDRSGLVQVVISPSEILKSEFEKEINRTCSEAQSLGYNPTRFLQMMNEYGAVETSKRLLASQDYIQEGVVRLWRLGRLDLSMEATVIQFSELFTEQEITIAQKRLEDLNYNWRQILTYTNLIKDIRPEYVLEISGVVQRRGDRQVNKDLATGEVEVLAKSVKILSEAETPPFEIDNEERQANEELRLKYRYLDLRHQRMKQNLEKRHQMIKFFRDYLSDQGFIEVQTPILTKSTPEGARDYLVPSRVHKGKFFALPQAPQQYKQLLMVAGIEKYFQIAPCFRDEDARKDRAPGEFYQLDMEMSFMSQDEILELTETLFTEMIKKVFPEKKIAMSPWPRLTHAEAMKKYKTDKPDLRKNKDDKDELAFCWIVDFPLFVDQGKEDEKFVGVKSQWAPSHNMFTAPQEKDIPLLDKNPGKVRSYQHDMVLNGLEVGGGAVRIHDAGLQEKVFDLIGFDKKQKKEFSHMLEAFKYGVPPHGGIAPGIDRLLATILGEKSIKEVIAFPLTNDARDPMMGAPAEVSKEQLKELGIKV